MKPIIGVLLAAVLLIALGLGLTRDNRSHALSANGEAATLCEDGTRDLNAFRLRDAVDKLGKCLALDPSLAEASIARTMAFTRLGERDNRGRELARADSLTTLITDDDRRMVAQLRLSGFSKSRFHAMGDSLLNRLQASDPRNIYVLVALATKAGMGQDTAAYEKAWLDILAVDPSYANSYNMLGYMEMNRGNYDQAIDYMQKYAFLAPDLANPHDSLGEVLMAIGRYEEAEAEFRTSVTMQPDFYVSLINLGKTYLARGQIKRGMDILERVRSEVAGSDLEKRVDTEIIHTFLAAGLEKDLHRMSAIFIGRYPADKMSSLLRAIRLTYMGQANQGRAVLDSTMTVWRQSDEYKNYEKARLAIDSANYQFEALLADAEGKKEAAVWNWKRALEQDPTAPAHEVWYLRYRLASDLLATGDPTAALAEADAMLVVNPRLISVLILKVRCHLALNQAEAAEAALAQLQWSVSKSDADFPARRIADELETQLTGQAGAQ